MLLDLRPSDIDWCSISVPQEKIAQSGWQCAYMEQYLNDSGTEKICETYDLPSNDAAPCRVVFFICKVPANALHTPYGDFKLQPSAAMPERLKNIIEFEDAD